MRQVIKLALMIVLCLSLLAGCGACEKNSAGTAEKIKEEFSLAENFDIGLNVTADYGKNVFEYKMKYSGNFETSTIEILEPKTIAGLMIAVESSAGTLKLKYDGAELDTGSLSDTDLSPVNALPTMLSQWRSGYVSETVEEKLYKSDCVLINYQVSDSVTLKTWFDAKTHLPVRSEFLSDGYTVIRCNFENVIIQ